MLRALVAHGVLPDFVVGASVRALNGMYFCCVPSTADLARLEGIWCELRRWDVFPVTLRRILGMFFDSASLVDPCGLHSLVERHLSSRHLESALIPMHIAATDLLSGASVVLSSGPAIATKG